MLGWPGGDNGDGGVDGLPRGEMGEALLDEGVGKGTCTLQCVLQPAAAVGGVEVGGVGARGEGGQGRVHAVQGEGPVGALRGEAAGEVRVGRHGRVHAGAVMVLGELGGLLVGQRGTEGGHTDVTATAGEADGDGVHRSLDEHRDRSPVKQGRVRDVQLGALAVGDGGRGVQVLRAVLTIVLSALGSVLPFGLIV